MHHRRNGFTLIEMMVVLAIIAIIAAIAIPSYIAFVENRRLISAAEFIAGKLNFARVEAFKQSKMIYFGISSGSGWTIGIGDQSTCTGASATNCTVSTSVNGTNENITYFFSEPVPGSNVTAAVQVGFNPVRGTATSSSIAVTNTSGNSLQVRVSALGRVIICSPVGSVGGYPNCGS